MLILLIPKNIERMLVIICSRELVGVFLHYIYSLGLFVSSQFSFLPRYKGGPVLPRKMISAGDSKQFSVEVFPLCLYLVDLRDKSETVIQLSKKVFSVAFMSFC